MDFIWSLLIFFFWIFIVNLASRGIKKVFGGGEQDKKPAPTQRQPEMPVPAEPEGPSPEEMFRELQKRMQEARRQRSVDQTSNEGRRYKDDTKEKQKVYQAREVTSEREKRSSEEFQRVLAAARKKQHDADDHHLERKATPMEVEQEALPEFELDLRNAVIGSIILERPYS